jgi:hypothetical protein
MFKSKGGATKRDISQACPWDLLFLKDSIRGIDAFFFILRLVETKLAWPQA